MRSFYILNERASSSGPNARGRGRLRYRDMVWAFYSESQEILLNASIDACGGKMTWDDAKALGIFIWMESIESMVRALNSSHKLTASLYITFTAHSYGEYRAQ